MNKKVNSVIVVTTNQNEDINSTEYDTLSPTELASLVKPLTVSMLAELSLLFAIAVGVDGTGF